MKLKLLEDAAVGARIGEGNIAKFKAAADGTRRAQAIRLRFHARLHLEEGQQIGKEKRLVGNSRSGGKCLLDIAHGLHDGGGDQGEIADAVVALEWCGRMLRSISPVVAKLAENGEQAAPEQPPAVEARHSLRRCRCESAVKRSVKIVAEIEELELLGRFFAAAYLAQVIHLPARRESAGSSSRRSERRSGFRRETRE